MYFKKYFDIYKYFNYTHNYDFNFGNVVHVCAGELGKAFGRSNNGVLFVEHGSPITKPRNKA